MFCNQCGHRNPEDARFCSSCGAPLDQPGGPRAADETGMLPAIAPVEAATNEETGEVSVVAADLPTGQGMLVVRRGPNAGSKFVLEGSTVKAGRHPRSDIFLDDITVSREHAEFVPRDGGGYDVRDKRSLNGTYLNRERIDRAPLANGDEVQIGKFKLVYLAAT